MAQPTPEAMALAARGMRNPNFGSKGLASYQWDEKKGLPRRENCDLTKPTEMFLWALVALPGVNGGYQVMPTAYNMVISEHLFEVGAMLECPQCGFSKDPMKKYQPPKAGEGHWLTSPGYWVTPETPDSQPHPAREALAGLTATQKAELLDELLRERELGDLNPANPPGVEE